MTWEKCVSRSVTFVLLALCAVSTLQAADTLFEPAYDTDSIYLQPTGEYANFVITVSGPDDIYYTMKFDGSETPVLSFTDADGNLLPDGKYVYEMKAAPVLDGNIRAALREAREYGETIKDVPRGKTESGAFTIQHGEIVIPTENEFEDAFTVFDKGDTEAPTTTTTTAGPESSEPYVVEDADAGRAQVIATDLTVQGSECVGFDCTSSESYGFDTIRLKENNLRIHFNDTSASASFPGNDWRIVANDSGNGGANYLAIEDSDAGRTPFKVEAGARNNALYVEADGDVGIGTANPVVTLHVVEGDSPALRIEQDGSSGFTPQTWDLAGNETNFFVRDVTNGSSLPFRIKPGSGNDDALVIDANGQIGLGDHTPDAALDIESGDLLLTAGNATINGDATVQGSGSSMLVEDTNTSSGSRALMELKNLGAVSMVFRNSSAGTRWDIGADNQGFAASDNTSGTASFKVKDTGETIITAGTLGTEIFKLDSAGNLTIPGSITSAKNKQSDVAELKQQLSDQAAIIASQEARLQALEALLK